LQRGNFGLIGRVATFKPLAAAALEFTNPQEIGRIAIYHKIVLGVLISSLPWQGMPVLTGCPDPSRNPLQGLEANARKSEDLEIHIAEHLSPPRLFWSYPWWHVSKREHVQNGVRLSKL
jgi:hypothetical protein